MNSVMVLAEDGTTQLLLQRLLESEGFKVFAAESLVGFDTRKDTPTIDLFIVDPSMTGGRGMELVRHIRNSSTSGIILLSPEYNEACVVKGFELGADDFITKPFRPRELAARVKAVHRRTAKPLAPFPVTEAHAGIMIGTFRLLSEYRSVLDSEGREVSLTTAEFNILQVLATRQGEVLSRDEIIGLSRGRDWQCYERSVDGLISRLRRKLAVPEGTAHFIKTVHGSGYTIVKCEVQVAPA